jgi:hypothetical protein
VIPDEQGYSGNLSRTSRSDGKLFYALLQNADMFNRTGYHDITLGVTGPQPKHNMLGQVQ